MRRRTHIDYARMSDPAFNPQFRRRWFERPTPKLPPVPRHIRAWRSDDNPTENLDRKEHRDAA